MSLNVHQTKQLTIIRRRRGDYRGLLYDNDAILPNKVMRTRKI